jgi:hypothetical protein
MVRRVAWVTAAILIFAGAVTAGAENLLLNSSFKLTTNQVTPDDWDLHHAAALQFHDLHAQYNYDDSQPGPVAGARVLKITNSLSGFPYLYLLSREPAEKLPAGDYVFSVYVKADRFGNTVDLSGSLGHIDPRVTKRVTTEWQRYSAEFHIDDPDKVQLSPLLVMPNRGTYWISAPQLERGAAMTPYAPSSRDSGLGKRTTVQQRAAAATVADIAAATTVTPLRGISARFEFNIYTDEPAARLEVKAGAGSSIDGTIGCASAAVNVPRHELFSAPITLSGGQSRTLEIPLAGSEPGEYSCDVTGTAGGPTSAKFTRLAPNPTLVRVNQWRNILELNAVAYQIRGVIVGDVIPPEWYFTDVVDHGLNTLLYWPRDAVGGGFNTDELDAVLKLVEKHGMKLIIGPAVMGEQNSSWKPRLDHYVDLMRRYRNNSSIIGWYVVDEPRAPTLARNDLLNIYARVKAADPYRLVFINWGSDDVPAAVGAEPHGTLAATDLYSIDYYPFSNDVTSMEIYTLRTIRVALTAALAARPAHYWIQLYGGADVSREPTGEELNYMMYVDLLYGANYSYWAIRSNAKPTWDRVQHTNGEISALMQLLWFNPAAQELEPPKLTGNYLYSAWKAPSGNYLIVLHVADRTEPFAMDMKRLFGSKIVQASGYFDKTPDKLVDGRLQDSFGAYATRVYRID